MKKLLLFAAVILATLFSACKDDTVYGSGDYSEGEAATLNLTIKVPKSKEVTMSRTVDADQESMVTELVLIGFEKNSGRREVIPLTPYLVSSTGPTEAAGRTYTLSQDVPTKSGHYRMYVIANWSSSFASKSFDPESISEADLKNAVFENVSQETLLTGGNGFPMSAYYDEFIINKGENDLQGSRAISLERANSLIEFTFVNGSMSGSNIPTKFTPVRYSVYNVPKQSAIFSTYVPETIERFDVVNQTVVQDGKFSFFMLQNDQSKSTHPNITQWKDREVWKYDGDNSVPFDKRVFTNAPSEATFVVVEGNYSGPASTENKDELFNGTVRFIIHLGNFGSSNAANKHDYNNFNVMRNENHKYTITVNSANSILANVAVSSNANAAYEGAIYNNNSVHLDSHYGKVMIRILKASLKENSDAIILSTPKNGFNQEPIAIKDLAADADYKWIQFQKPADANTFPVYAGINADGTCAKVGGREWGYITDLAADPTKYCYDDGNEYWYTAAFIDEYVYSGSNAMSSMADWAGANQLSRQMVLNPQDPRQSADEQSIVGGPASFIVSQWPIITSYDLTQMNPTTTNPFGFENIAEPTNCSLAATNANFVGALKWDATESTRVITSDINGQNNTYVAFSDKTLNVVDEFWSMDASGQYTFHAANIENVSDAITARNRDLNGNGVIDQDEIRWYVPTMTQMLVIWFTRDGIPDRFKLFNKDLCNSTQDLDTYYPRFLTSTYTGFNQLRRIYWYDQGAYGAEWQLNETWFTPWQMVRFCRNLGASADAYKSDITRLTQDDADNRVITINALATTVRNTPYVGAYPAHTLFDSYNRVPRELEYADSVLTIYHNPTANAGSWGPFWANNFGDGTMDTQTQTDNLNAAVLKAYNILHTDQTYTELPDGWRVPNQREMQMLIINGMIEKFLGITMPGNSDSYTKNPFESAGIMFSCTYPYGTGYASKQFPLCWNDGVLTLNNLGSVGNHRGFVILVRDKNWQEAVNASIAKLRKKGIVRKR